MVLKVTVGFRGWFLYIRSALKGWKLAGKAHPNIYKTVTLFQSEQDTTEVSLMQLAAGQKYESGDYSLSELVKACSHWVSM